MKTELITWLTEEIFIENGAKVLYKDKYSQWAENKKDRILVCSTQPFEKLDSDEREKLIKIVSNYNNEKIILPVCGELDFLMEIKEFRWVLNNCKRNNIEVILEYNLDWSALFGVDGFKQRYTAKEMAIKTGESEYLVYSKTLNKSLYLEEFDELPIISLGIRIDTLGFKEDVFKYILDIKKNLFALDYVRINQTLFDRDTEKDTNEYFEELLAGNNSLEAIIVNGD